MCAADGLSVACGAFWALMLHGYQVICIHIYTAPCGCVARLASLRDYLLPVSTLGQRSEPQHPDTNST